jgi:hypothetical protein
MSRPPLAYGMSRRGVKYADVSEAADTLFRAKERPTVEKVRVKLGRGSPNTIGPLLDEWWSRLADRLDAGPAALHRLPELVAQAAEALWIQALEEGRRHASVEQNSKTRALVQDQQQTDLRAQVLSLREEELQTTVREREQNLAESRDQVAALIKELAGARATMRAQMNRITELSTEVERLRQQVALIVTRAVTQQRTVTKVRPRRVTRAKATPRVKLRPAARKAVTRRRAPKHRKSPRR